MELLEDLTWAGQRTLVFSQSKKMLDIIQVRGIWGRVSIARTSKFCGSFIVAAHRKIVKKRFKRSLSLCEFGGASLIGRSVCLPRESPVDTILARL